jgi:methionyl-tRNA formyltransferase
VPVSAVQSKNELDQLIAHRPFRSTLGILIDFGIIVSQAVIDYFPLGIINSHFSLLPQWRGADPITFSILSGQKTTGVSLMLLTAGLDEGPLLAQMPIEIPSESTTPELTNLLIDASYQSLREIIPLYTSSVIQPTPQEAASILSDKIPTYSHRLTKDDGRLDWSKPAEQLEREVRAFLGWPGSRTVLAGKDVIVTKAHVVEHQEKPGQITATNKQLLIATAQNALSIDRLKPASKPEMPVTAFLAGYKQYL